MKNTFFRIVSISILLVMMNDIFAQDVEKVKFTAQIRPRFEWDNRTLSTSTKPWELTYLRTRLGAIFNPAKGLYATIQIQDSRIFGEEATTTTNLKNVDLKQAFIKLDNLFDLDVDAQVGRFALAFGTERLIGFSDWGNTGRSFDGLLASFKGKSYKIDAFVLREVEKLLPSDSLDKSFFGVYGDFKFSEKIRLQPYLLLQRTAPIESINRYTAGFYSNVKLLAGFYAEGEFAFQFGNLSGTGGQQNISASLFTGKLGYTLNASLHPSLEVGVDYLSGNDGASATEYKSFDVLYGTTHRSYGYMDYFTSFPRDTYDKGLMDIFFNLNIMPSTSFRSTAAFHIFKAAQDVTLSDKSISKNFGSEVDVLLSYQYNEYLRFEANFSYFSTGEIFKDKKKGDGNGTWLYLMTVFNL